MRCALCGSEKQAEFGAEMNIRSPGLEGLRNPIVWVFPKVVVCLVCGFSRFTTPENELAVLAQGIPMRAASISADVASRQKAAV
jgi:hypothetical protein